MMGFGPCMDILEPPLQPFVSREQKRFLQRPASMQQLRELVLEQDRGLSQEDAQRAGVPNTWLRVYGLRIGVRFQWRSLFALLASIRRWQHGIRAFVLAVRWHVSRASLPMDCTVNIVSFLVQHDAWDTLPQILREPHVGMSILQSRFLAQLLPQEIERLVLVQRHIEALQLRAEQEQLRLVRLGSLLTCRPEDSGGAFMDFLSRRMVITLIPDSEPGSVDSQYSSDEPEEQ
jgi:hypothetical protein